MTEYEKDYQGWLKQQVELLRNNQLFALDIPNLIEELMYDVHNNENVLDDELIGLLTCLLQWKYCHDKRNGYTRGVIRRRRSSLLRLFKNSPSLKFYYLANFIESYRQARLRYLDEARSDSLEIPLNSPFAIDQVLDYNFFP